MLTKRAVRPDVCMTGEITLRGQILPVGGIKEKVLAAHRAGLNIVLLPKENESDLDALPQEVLKDIKFVPVETLDQVLKWALEEMPKDKS